MESLAGHQSALYGVHFWFNDLLMGYHRHVLRSFRGWNFAVSVRVMESYLVPRYYHRIYFDYLG